MSYIRNKSEEKTGFQSGSPMIDSVDFKNDFAMVYRLDESFEERIRQHAEKGYVVHFMTGIAWGRYIDYLSGEWDGREHWDESQTDRYGNVISHGYQVPYMVPTVSFADYISEKLRKVVDAGAIAIHVEEPEFWDRAGYSPAFKREYELYYREKWTAPHESLDAAYKCAKLKAYLYTRTIDRVSSSLKEYAITKYGRILRFYVPTHSLLNYTQWKIVSPEGKLSDIPGVDGCIAQVWTGTSREKNWYNGVFRERTFETAYLEYGVMQELVKRTGRKMWFLHDPIEDNPIFDWNDYRNNYFCTVIASLLHPGVSSYEICPWPNRVFTENYPRGSENAAPIPDDYATILNNNFNTLGDMETLSENNVDIGILMGDCQLYQRTYPDTEFSEKAEEKTGTVLTESENEIKKFRNELFKAKEIPNELMLKFLSSNAFPGFYGLAMPLLKYGVEVRPVLLDNARRYTGYLDDYKTLIMSYEFMKPDSPDINTTIAEWVSRGGTLIYVGDGFDPYHKVRSWWSDKYDTPADHLFEIFGIDKHSGKISYSYGKGTVAYLKLNPAVICFSAENAESYRNFITDIIGRKEYKNYLYLERGNYIIAAVMDESICDEPLTLYGNFADMMEKDFSLVKEKTIIPGEKAFLYNLDKLSSNELLVIGTSVRINEAVIKDENIILKTEGAALKNAFIRIKTPFRVSSASFDNDESAEVEYNDKTQTALIKFKNVTGDRVLTIK